MFNDKNNGKSDYFTKKNVLVIKRVGSKKKKPCPGCIGEISGKISYLVGTLIGGVFATSWFDLDLTFDLAMVTLTFKILSRHYLGNCKVKKIDTWWEDLLGV